MKPKKVVSEISYHQVAFVVVDRGRAAKQASIEKTLNRQARVALGLPEMFQTFPQRIQIGEEADDTGIDVGADNLVRRRRIVPRVVVSELSGQFERVLI